MGMHHAEAAEERGFEGKAFSSQWRPVSATRKCVYNYSHRQRNLGAVRIVAAPNSSSPVNSARFGLYSTFSLGGFYVNAMAGGGYNAYDIHRHVAFTGLNRTAHSSPDGWEIDTLVGAGYDWNFGNAVLGVTSSLQYQNFSQNSFSETGARSLDTAVASSSTNSLRSSLGIRAAYAWQATANIKIVPEARISWQHEYLNDSRVIGAALDNGAGPNFQIFAGTAGRDNAFGAVGCSAYFGDSWRAYLYYNPEFGGDITAHTIAGGISHSF